MGRSKRRSGKGKGKALGIYALPRIGETEHISSVIERIKNGEAIKLPIDSRSLGLRDSWLDEATDMPPRLVGLLNNKEGEEDFIIRKQTPIISNWCAEFVKEAFKRAEHELPSLRKVLE